MKKLAIISVLCLVAVVAWAQADTDRRSVSYPVIEPYSPPWLLQYVRVTNFPAVQTVAGTVSVGNFPATQTVTGSVEVSNLPTVLPVSGTVDVGNLPVDTDGDLRVGWPPVRNELIDLLDTNVLVTPSIPWESELFETADFTRALVKLRTLSGSQDISCSLNYQWEPAGDFIGGGWISWDGGLRVIDSSVAGLQAKVTCSVTFAVSTATLSDVQVLLRRE